MMKSEGIIPRLVMETSLQLRMLTCTTQSDHRQPTLQHGPTHLHLSHHECPLSMPITGPKSPIHAYRMVVTITIPVHGGSYILLHAKAMQMLEMLKPQPTSVDSHVHIPTFTLAFLFFVSAFALKMGTVTYL